LRPQRIIIWVTAFFVVGIWVGLNFREAVYIENGSTLDRFFRYLENEYVDTLDIPSLEQDAMDYILSNLDPHSVLIPQENEAEISERMQGSFSGVGVEFTIYRDTLVFVHIMEGGPAEDYGLQAGDRIYAIDNDTIVGPDLTNEVVTEKIKGPIDTYVVFKIKRDGLLLTAAVQRGMIPLESVTGTRMFGPIGYTRIERFAESTYEELVDALEELSAQGMRALVLDLRDNPGGYLHEAVDIADLFLEEGKTIVSTKYKNGRTNIAEATGLDGYEDLPIHIVINGQSASASEVVSGALQDHDRATIYGSTSFGKGLVQEDKILPDGSTVRLTVAYYYTPSGRSIQKPYDGADLPGEMEGLVFTSDSGKVLATSGGIEPDIPVLNDTTQSYYWGFSFGTIDDFAFEWVDGMRPQIQMWDKPDFIQNHSVSDELLWEFLDYGGYGILLDDLSSKEIGELRLLLKSALAKNIWGFDAYRLVLQEQDPILNEVVRQASGSLE
jgi:carboxyl-terminal processing protease